ncbi:hypothetical protein JMUB7533_26750 [Staphylococcus aureus]
MSQAVKVERRETLKQKPNTSQLGFGKYCTAVSYTHLTLPTKLEV